MPKADQPHSNRAKQAIIPARDTSLWLVAVAQCQFGHPHWKKWKWSAFCSLAHSCRVLCMSHTLTIKYSQTLQSDCHFTHIFVAKWDSLARQPDTGNRLLPNCWVLINLICFTYRVCSRPVVPKVEVRTPQRGRKIGGRVAWPCIMSCATSEVNGVNGVPSLWCHYFEYYE